MSYIYFNNKVIDNVIFNNNVTQGYFNGSILWGKPTIYTLTLTNDGHGTLTADTVTGYSGDIITLTNTPNSRYITNGYDTTGCTVSNNKITLTGNCTVKSKYKGPYYKITTSNDGHGTCTYTIPAGSSYGTNSALSGATISLSTAYNTYYRFKDYNVTGCVLSTNTFKISADSTIKANYSANVFTASGSFNTYNLAPLGRNRSIYRFWPKCTYHTTNVPTTFYTSQTSYAQTTSAASTAYKTTASGTTTSAFVPTGTISGYKFSGYLQTSGYSDYTTARWSSCNYGLWANGSQRVTGSPLKPTTAKAYFLCTTNGTTTVTGQTYISGGLTGTVASDNITLCNGTSTNKWVATGYLP